MTAEELIAALGLQPHPEGGAYRETYRSSESVQIRGGRFLATCIYFVLRAGEVSQWHKVASDELWLFHGGDPLTLKLKSDADSREMTLGMNILSGEQPQVLVPAGIWQSAAARQNGAQGWTLVGCVVAPGFDFADFELEPDAQ